MSLRKEFLYGLVLPCLFTSTGLIASDSQLDQAALKNGISALQSGNKGSAAKQTTLKDESDSDTEEPLAFSSNWTGGAQAPQEKKGETVATPAIPVVDDIDSSDLEDESDKKSVAKPKVEKGKRRKEKLGGSSSTSDTASIWAALNQLGAEDNDSSDLADLPTVTVKTQTAPGIANHRRTNTQELVSKLSIITEQNSMMIKQQTELIMLMKQFKNPTDAK
ncbi:hypothetical protein [Candidatus Finniella inopinata]|uniref:YbgF trimerisation domain-containing protein n=1 Tax=Candidatus Finniella inopinata TaxID=1696036 RepID=A0A4Q7DJY1_9PROT|nr:hypothetical protein [Candidatus Finniella inopinata]RZI46589.1 hypothetical protein EQU50_03105 [Candidatus Finniella inopinata]